jgi:hypothetical protein
MHWSGGALERFIGRDLSDAVFSLATLREAKRLLKQSEANVVSLEDRERIWEKAAKR